jgi:hypothetical protein
MSEQVPGGTLCVFTFAKVGARFSGFSGLVSFPAHLSLLD